MNTGAPNRMNPREKAGARHWLTILVVVTAVSLTLGSWQELKTHERTQLESEVEVKAQANYTLDNPVASQQRPDLILMDLSLPEIDGWSATHQIKAEQTTCHIPVIALTANAMHGERERTLEAGCDEYLTKPVEFPRLLAEIERFLNERTAP